MIHRHPRFAALALLAIATGSAHAANCPRTSVDPTTISPAATVGADYAQPFTASNTNGLPFVYTITSGLPASSGLTIKATTGEVTGRPTQVGNYLFTVTGTDTSGCSGGRTYPLAVGQGSQAITFTTTPPETPQVGDPSYQIGATASSGLSVSLSIDAASNGICAITGSDGPLSSVALQGVGTCVVNANQAGDTNWHAAPPAQQSFAIGKADQAISFTSTAPTGTQVGGAAYTVTATSSSGLPVTFTVDASATNVCSIAGSSVTFQGVGNCVIDANQAGNATYNAAPQVQQTFGVGKTDQTISFTSTAPVNATVAGTAYTVAATATSSLAVTFAIDASAASVCAITGASVTFQSAGTCVINANQAGNATYSPAPQVQQSFAVGKGSQTITFVSPSPTPVVGGTPYVVAATATSLLPVIYMIDPAASAVCAITGTSVTFTGTGTCTINANQAGNANWNAAPQAQQSFAVGKGSQTITVTSTAPSAAAVSGATYIVTATSSAGLAVTFTIDPVASGICTIAGSTVSFIGAGTCAIDANQAGNAAYNAAPQVQQTFAVGKGSQTITFTSTAPAGAAVGGPTYTVAATASSGLGVAFTVDPIASSVCTIAGSTVSFIGAGTCVIDANQAGNAAYNAAPQAQQTFAVAKGSQTITVNSTAPTAAAVGGSTYAVTATSSSGLVVAFTIDPVASGVCTIAGSTVSFIGAGTCVIDANQAGNAAYNAAPQVQQTFAVAKGSQTITYTSTAPAAKVGGPTYTVAATASSGLAVTFAIHPSASAVCSIAGSTVSFAATGTCVINASQPGNANWNAAPAAQQIFAVAKGDQTVSFTTAAPIGAAVGGPTYTVGATSSAGLPVTLSIDAATASKCTIAGAVVSFVHTDTCSVNATQAGNANWNAAQAQQTFEIAAGIEMVQFTSATPTDARYLGPSYTVTATTVSGRPVSFFIDPDSTVCSLSGGNVVDFIGPGTCRIIAFVNGDADWGSAQSSMIFAVGKAAQTITFTSTAPNTAIGNTYTPTATATSALPVAFSIDPDDGTTICSIDGAGVVTLEWIGTCVINANQPGDALWGAAPQVQQSFDVTECLQPALGEVVKGSMPGASSFCISNTSGGPMEFTYLPINNSPSTQAFVNVVGNGISAVTGPPSPRPAGDLGGLAPLAAPAAAGDALVDTHETMDTSPFPGNAIPKSALISKQTKIIPPGPLAVGQLIDLNANMDNSCSTPPDTRKARVEAISTPQHTGQPLLYAVQEVVETTPGAGDWHPPVVGGYTTGDFQIIVDSVVQAPPGSTALGSNGTTRLLKTGGMDILTGNFGAMTDLDNNGGVILFFTPAVNAVAPASSSVQLLGAFQSRDLFSSAPASCPGSNEGEMLYLMVPDPTGQINSNVRTWSSMIGQATSTILHHLQHLTNATRHIYVSNAPALEERWLDEALSHAMMELTFFSTSVGLTPRSNIVVTNLTTGPNASVRVAAFNTFENPMLGGLRNYYLQPLGSIRSGPLTQTTTGVSSSHDSTTYQFATTWAFLRYAMDRKNTGDAGILSALVDNPTLRGRENLRSALGIGDLDEWGRDFLVAMYTDDAVAGIAPEYMAPSWNYRSIFTALNGAYPMTVDPLTNGTTRLLSLGVGGGTRYARFAVADGQTATINTTVAGSGGGPPPATVTTALIRTK